ncbi:hypothetical protein GPX89_02265 [Nocardia sp. ET3-3]|uniref:Uncharacterized protein n=1 Tax=Nocardia terrae TaxID=2675851 RepID=A0A7K1UP06_9NOCA|nr:hypothetical protein [Nocardia terrae]MVU76066.1 hypothetical protein [Nocardia terrae]
MQNESNQGANEPALVTALVAPLVKLRAAVGDGARPADATMSAMAALPGTVRASDDAHRGGLEQLASSDTARAAVPVIRRTGGELAALADVSESLAPLLTSAYDMRDHAATSLDNLISGFRAQATPLVNAARSQADLDSVVNLAADFVRDAVGVIKAADGHMDALIAEIGNIEQPGVTVRADLRLDRQV